MSYIRNEIKDSRGFTVGYSLDTGKEIQYFGYTKGYIGRFDRTLNRWYWMSGSLSGKMGPTGDIGYSEVLKAEGKM